MQNLRFTGTFSFIASVTFQTALPRFFWRRLFFESAGRGQVDPRTRIRLSSGWISGACHVGWWSKPTGPGLEDFRGR